MGICIHMEISKSVEQKVWEKVYEETLFLVKHFPFADRRRVTIHGISTICLTPTEERVMPWQRFGENPEMGWMTCGDYNNMSTAENYSLDRILLRNGEFEPDAGDAILGTLPAYIPSTGEDERCRHTYHLWGAKTQGETYHIYLLAVACLIEARLGEKAFIYGDITRGQCRKAVELANKYLEKPIDLPDRCDADRLFNRISKLDCSENEKLTIMELFYLGTKDSQFGEYMRQYFSEKAMEEYWKEKINDYKIGTVGFNNNFQEYLTLGFDLDKLCTYVKLEDEAGNENVEKFIRRVLDAKLHLKDKNCADALEINQEEEKPYGIGILFAQFAFSGARNKKVDRFIPIDEIRGVLKKHFEDKCDVDSMIDAYLADEEKQIQINVQKENISDEEFEKAVLQDPAEVLNQVMNSRKEKFENKERQYDISRNEDLEFYEKGDTMHPKLVESIRGSRAFLDSLLNEAEYAELMQAEVSVRCQWMVDNNHYMLIRDKDWEKVFSDIEKNKESFSRYYSLFRVSADSDGQVELIRDMMLNDDLYAFSGSNN